MTKEFIEERKRNGNGNGWFWDLYPKLLLAAMGIIIGMLGYYIVKQDSNDNRQDEQIKDISAEQALNKWMDEKTRDVVREDKDTDPEDRLMLWQFNNPTRSAIKVK